MVANFWIARFLGRRALERLVGKERMNDIDRFSNNYGLIALLTLRVFESELQKIISYAFGLTSVAFFPYAIVSTIGMIPGTVVWYILSGTVQNPLLFTVLTQALGIGLSVLFIVGLMVRRRGRGLERAC
jgi:uncharacterized membrane protein YdjX (TVP38/TMEM64 family)